jgi:CBS domain-containing protein
MARYRGELDDDRGDRSDRTNRGDRGDREARPQEERLRREAIGANEERWSSRREFESRRHPYYNRYGERADYEYDEPRYGGRERYRDEEFRGSALYEGRGSLAPRYSRERYASARSRLRCRDIMTRDLAVSTRDSTLREVAIMMKQEDTGVIPVVDYDTETSRCAQLLKAKTARPQGPKRSCQLTFTPPGQMIAWST